ncbi:MAG: DUF6159 family protein [Dehalococcoidia bacterium]
MFQGLARSWQLYKVCWNVLIHDKELLLFPLLSTVSLIITFASIFSSGTLLRLATVVDENLGLLPRDYFIMGIFYFINYFIIVYFNAAIIGAARIRFEGGDPTLKDGFRIANSHFWSIAGWALISAIVSLFFYAIEKFARAQAGGGRGGLLVLVLIILSSIARVAWSVITYLVVPVLVVEGVGPIEAIKRSAGMVRRTWGEQLVSRFGFDLMIIVFAIPIVLFAVIIAAVIPAPVGIFLAFAVGGIGIGLLLLVTAAMRAIYVAALYEYAANGSVPQLFPENVVINSWETRPDTA